MKNKNVLLAVLGGVAAGALIGLLVTRNNRENKRLDQKFMEEDYFGGLKDKYGDLLQRLNEKLDALKGEAEVNA